MSEKNIDPLIGSLQAKVMHYIWSEGPVTVHQVRDAINVTGHKLAYTLILTVMRNLVRRKLLDQKPVGHSHMFTALVSKVDYQKQVIAYVIETYFESNHREFDEAAA